MRLRLFVLLSILYSLSCSSSEEPAPDTPQVEVGDISKTEGDDGITVVDFNIGLAKAVAEDVILKYATDDASAFQGLDYKKASGQITIPAGSAEASISLEIVADLIKEGNEQFKLLLSSDMDVEFNKGTVLVTIGNDDTQLPYDTEDYETPASYAGWSLAWADEFDGTEINTEWWTHEIGNGDNGWGNNELEYYTGRHGEFEN
jgi:hypothetical protein